MMLYFIISQCNVWYFPDRWLGDIFDYNILPIITADEGEEMHKQ
jgi:hypothetical protein